MRLIILAILALLSGLTGAVAAQPQLYVVSFTADWCPNCKILDPRVDKAMESFSSKPVEHVTFDMTNGETRQATFNKADGTVLAGVYGDHLGVTGIAILTAADSGEKLGCATRDHSAAEIQTMVREALAMIETEPALSRRGGLGKCPAANRKISM